MRPLGGSMARLAWADSRRALLPQRGDRRGVMPRTVQPAVSRTMTTTTGRTSSHHRSRRPVFGLQARLFSSQDTPKGTSPPQSSSKENDAHSRNGGSATTRPADAPATELPSVTDSRRSDLNQKFSHIMDNVQARVLTASQTLNDITGYSAIEGVKRDNEALEAQLSDAHARVSAARQAYKSSNTKRATTQREVTTLLARKDTWSPVDLERFTELYRADHVLEGEVAAAQEALTEAEAQEQNLSQRLNAGILKRYHEEQIWSDRIRRASTWGTWGLMGMNFVLFVVFQFFAEPWRRRRLVRGVVDEEKRVLEEVRGELEAVKLSLAKQDEARLATSAEETGLTVAASKHAIAAAAAAPPSPSIFAQTSWTDLLRDPSRCKAFAADLFSERRIDLRMKDASALALQGAVTGAAAGGIAMLLVMRSS